MPIREFLPLGKGGIRNGRMGFARRAVSVCLVGMVLRFATGCVAVDVGRPETFPNTETVRELDRIPARIRVERARVQLKRENGHAEVAVVADIREEREWREIEKTTTVRRQKRLAFGFFPGAAEIVWMPEGALASAMTVPRADYDLYPRYVARYANVNPDELKIYAGEQFLLLLFSCGLIPAFDTIESLVIAPFGRWSCSGHDFVDLEHFSLDGMGGGKARADASASPKLRALAEFPQKTRAEIGISTCFDEAPVTPMRELGHFGLFGFHKYLAVTVELPESGRETARGVETGRKQTEIAGPYEVELSIPGLGYSRRCMVEQGQTHVAVPLPEAGRDIAIEARVSVRECRDPARGKMPDLTKQAIRNLAGQASRFEVNLRARGEEAASPLPDWEIVQIHPDRGGKYLVRVRVGDPSARTAAVRSIIPEVRRRIREDYANRHPAARVEDVRDSVQWKTDDNDPSLLLITGWAFSARPLASGWTWNEKTRRGTVRILLSGDIPEERARQWARENIRAIVADKGVALTAGGNIPGGADVRCLSGHCENGILTIEFKAVE